MHLMIAVVLIAVVAATTPAQAARGWDGQPWSECEQRYTQAHHEIKSGRTSLGWVRAYGCSQGFFVHVKSNKKAQLGASLLRDGSGSQARGYYGFSVTTDMLHRTRGKCYTAYGSIGGVGKQFRFCA